MNVTPTRSAAQTYTSAPSLTSRLFNLFEKTLSTAPTITSGAIFLVDGRPLPLLGLAIQREEASVQHESLSLTLQLDGIKDLLGLTVTQLSELFKVTRKTVYDWYDGADPRPIVMSRVSALHRILVSASSSVDLKRLKHVWNLPLSGDSFVDVLNGPLEQHALEAALSDKIGELADRMVSPTRRVSKGSRDLRNIDLDGIIRDADVDR